MLKTAIIGAGKIAYSHAEAIVNLGIEISGVLDYDLTKSKALAKKYGTKVIKNLSEILQDIDMVHILTPPSKRVEYVRQAAEAGKHIFIEKPIASSIDDAQEIISLSEANKVKLMVGFNHRFRRAFRMLQDVVNKKELGDIIYVFSHRYNTGTGFGFRRSPLKASWRTDPKLACGMSIESISHDIDMLLHLVDGVVSVNANTYGTISEIPTFDNNTAVTFALKNRGIGSISASWCSYILYSCRGVLGTEGTAMIIGDDFLNFNDFILKTKDMPYQTLTRINDRFERTIDDTFTLDSYVTINRLFKECIEQDLVSPSPGVDGLRALIFSKAILESNKTGKSVAVNL